jgi:hypothetical protein
MKEPQEQDSSRINPLDNPEHQKHLSAIMAADKKMHELCLIPNAKRKHRLEEGWKDYRYYLNVSKAATEKLLSRTSRDPFYTRSNPVITYPSRAWDMPDEL